jgi:lytic murein transglycosylase
MDRRLFLMSGVVGLIDPVTPLVRTAAGLDPPTQSGDEAFDAWALDFLTRQVAAGWPQGPLRAALSGLEPDPRVVAADRRQPEFTRSVGDYMRVAVSDDRVASAQAGLAAHHDVLQTIQARFGVDPAVLIGVWGLESDFGVMQGDYDVIRSLATLAADGRRRRWAEGELLAAVRILVAGEAPRERLTGSWAGAMGQTQFLPSMYLKRAVDIDGDGKRDIWGSAPDALGSAANLLASAGWHAGQGWAYEAILPQGFDFALAESDARPPAFWTGRGVRRADGQPWSAADATAPCVLLAPAGASGPAFLALPNHFVIRAYNNSTSYALAVGLIADAATGGPPLATPWPVEAPLSRADRSDAQSALVALGYDAGAADGLIGTRTHAALKAWQGARGLIPDGHLTIDLAGRLRDEAHLGTPPGAGQ